MEHPPRGDTQVWLKACATRRGGRDTRQTWAVRTGRNTRTRAARPLRRARHGGRGPSVPRDGGFEGRLAEASGDALVELSLALTVAPRGEVVFLPDLPPTPPPHLPLIKPALRSHEGDPVTRVTRPPMLLTRMCSAELPSHQRVACRPVTRMCAGASRTDVLWCVPWRPTACRSIGPSTLP